MDNTTEKKLFSLPADGQQHAKKHLKTNDVLSFLCYFVARVRLVYDASVM